MITDAELFRIGEYYFRAGVLQQARYAFKKLMEHYPDSKYAGTAMERISAIASGKTDIPSPGLDAISDIKSDSSDLGDFSIEEKPENDYSPRVKRGDSEPPLSMRGRFSFPTTSLAILMISRSRKAAKRRVHIFFDNVDLGPVRWPWRSTIRHRSEDRATDEEKKIYEKPH